VHYVRRLTRKHFFQRKVALLAKQSESAFLAMFVQNVSNMHSLMMSVLVFGAAFLSASAAASSVALPKDFFAN
jgi:hypothetical protein